MSRPLRIVWVGFHEEGRPALQALLAAGYAPVAVLTLEDLARSRRSAALDPGQLDLPESVPVHLIRNINDEPVRALLQSLEPDLLLVIGWSQILHPEVLRIPKLGCIGAHASLLPRNRGSAPINWAIIRGEVETGNSLIWLREGVDTGEIIDQTAFPITPYDTCASLYEQVGRSNAAMLVRALGTLARGERIGQAQEHSGEPPLPRRRPEDGRLDWAWPAGRVYDFIRALARPYPGAFGKIAGATLRIWQAALPPGDAVLADPGVVLGPVVSPVEAACGQLVACGVGAVVLLEVETETGQVLRGRELSRLDWTGRRWDAC